VPSCELSQAPVSPGQTQLHGLSPQKIHPGVCQEVLLGLGLCWGCICAAGCVMARVTRRSHSDVVCVEAPATFPWWREENKQQEGLNSPCGKHQMSCTLKHLFSSRSLTGSSEEGVLRLGLGR